jgi:hypothetical protein
VEVVLLKRTLPTVIALACVLMVARGGEHAKQALALGSLPNVSVSRDEPSVNVFVGGRIKRIGQSAPTLQITSDPPALDNPVNPNRTTRSQVFTINVGAENEAAIRRLRRRDGYTPVNITIYAPPGAVTPTSQTVYLSGNNTASAQFTYNGTYFSTPMTVAAVLGTGSMTAAIFTAHKPACDYTANQTSYLIAQNDPLKFGVSGGFHLNVSVGDTVSGVQLDTGSTGFLINDAAFAGSNVNAIGPGQLGFETLEPSDLTLIGHYWLAPVTLMTTGSSSTTIDTTVPMEVLSVEYICQDGTQCQPDTGTALMGVGFGRPTPPPGQLYLKDPLENVFLQLQDAVQGNLHLGYILSTDHMYLGLNQQSTSTFPASSFIGLKKFPHRRGDWQSPPACVTFNGGTPQCGSMLLDIGIDSMIAAGFATPSPLQQITVQSPNATSPILSYSFPYPVPASATPPAPDPNGISQGNAIQFDPAPRHDSAPFVNVGRDPIAVNDYLYDAQCGEVAFGPPTL